jgi:hypothetical protein
MHLQRKLLKNYHLMRMCQLYDFWPTDIFPRVMNNYLLEANLIFRFNKQKGMFNKGRMKYRLEATLMYWVSQLANAFAKKTFQTLLINKDVVLLWLLVYWHLFQWRLRKLWKCSNTLYYYYKTNYTRKTLIKP